MVKPALGRGLGALMGGVSPVAKAPAPEPSAALVPTAAAPPDDRERVDLVAPSNIRPCAFQPRKVFSEEALRELTESIRQSGVLQPLIVRRVDGHFELIAGERRWRAAQAVGLQKVPVLVRKATDQQVLEMALVENLQRADLNPMEEALGYVQLAEKFNLTQEAIAARVGKSRAHVANVMRFARLPADVQAHLRGGVLTPGHAKVLLGLPAAQDQSAAARQMVDGGMSVREAESCVARFAEAASKTGDHAGKKPAIPMDVHAAEVQRLLQEKLGTKVLLRYRKGRGAIEIRYFSDDELERLLGLLGVQAD